MVVSWNKFKFVTHAQKNVNAGVNVSEIVAKTQTKHQQTARCQHTVLLTHKYIHDVAVNYSCQ